MEFGLVIGFTEHLQIVIRCNYNKIRDIIAHRIKKIVHIKITAENIKFPEI
jgi:hypothetical protein